MNRLITEEELCTARKYMTNCSKFLAIKDVKLKQRCTIFLQKECQLSRDKNTTNASVALVVKKPSYIDGGNVT